MKLVSAGAVSLVLVMGACTAGPIEVLQGNPASWRANLVAYWPMDDGEQDAGLDAGTDGGMTAGMTASMTAAMDPSLDAGTDAARYVADRSGNAHRGVLTGGTWVPGRFGGALHLEAPNDQVTVITFPAAMPDWSVSLWVRLPMTPVPFTPPDPFLTLLSTEVPKGFGMAGGWEMNLGQRTTNMLDQNFFQFAYWVGPAVGQYDTYNTQMNVTPGEWTHIAAVVDSSAKTLSFYINGELQPDPQAVSEFIKPTSDSTLFMGAWTGAGRRFTGDLDDVVIYSRVLNPGEVKTLSENAVPIKPP